MDHSELVGSVGRRDLFEGMECSVPSGAILHVEESLAVLVPGFEGDHETTAEVNGKLSVAADLELVFREMSLGTVDQGSGSSGVDVRDLDADADLRRSHLGGLPGPQVPPEIFRGRVDGGDRRCVRRQFRVGDRAFGRHGGRRKGEAGDEEGGSDSQEMTSGTHQ